MSDKLKPFVEFLGSINADCSGDALKHTVDDKGNLSFEKESTSAKYSAYRKIMANGYKLGLKQGRIDALNEIAIDCMNKLKGE